jgi:hypothetical protein
MKVRVDSAIFFAAMKFAAKGDVRYYLNGVYVEPNASGGVTIVATNGHVMALMYDATGFSDGKYIIPTITLPKSNSGKIEFDGESCVLENENSYKCKFITGRYPDYMAVMPEVFPTGAPPYCNIGYLALCQHVTQAYEQKCDQFSICGNGSDQSCVVNFGPKVPAIVIIMPLRYDRLTEYPKFLTSPKVDVPAMETEKQKRVRKPKARKS